MYANNAISSRAVILLLILQVFSISSAFNWHGPSFRDYEYPELQLLLTAKEEGNNSKDEESNSNVLKINDKGDSSLFHSEPSDIVDVLSPKKKPDEIKVRPWMKTKYSDQRNAYSPNSRFAVKSKAGNFKIRLDNTANDNVRVEEHVISAKSIRPQTSSFVTNDNKITPQNLVTDSKPDKIGEEMAQQKRSPGSVKNRKFNEQFEVASKNSKSTLSDSYIDKENYDSVSHTKYRDRVKSDAETDSARNEDGQELDEDNEAEEVVSSSVNPKSNENVKSHQLAYAESDKRHASSFVQNNYENSYSERRQNSPMISSRELKRNHNKPNGRPSRRVSQNDKTNKFNEALPRIQNNTNVESSEKLSFQGKVLIDKSPVKQYGTIINVDNKAFETLVTNDKTNIESAEDSNRKVRLADSQLPISRMGNSLSNEKNLPQNSLHKESSKSLSIQNNNMANSGFSLTNNTIPMTYPIPEPKSRSITANVVHPDIVARAPIKLLVPQEKKPGKALANNLPLPEQRNPLDNNIGAENLNLQEDSAINAVDLNHGGPQVHYLMQAAKGLPQQYMSNFTIPIHDADKLSLKVSTVTNNSEDKHVLLKKSLNMTTFDSQNELLERGSNSHDDAAFNEAKYYSLTNTDAPSAKLSALLYKVKDKRNLMNLIRRKKINRSTTSVKRSIGDAEYENYEYDSSPNGRPASQDYEYDEEYDTEYENSRALTKEDSSKRRRSDFKHHRPKEDEPDEYYFYIDKSNSAPQNKNVVNTNGPTKGFVSKHYEDLFAHPLSLDDPELEIIHGEQEGKRKGRGRKQHLPKRRRIKPAEELKEVGYKDYSEQERKLIDLPQESRLGQEHGEDGELNPQYKEKQRKKIVSS